MVIAGMKKIAMCKQFFSGKLWEIDALRATEIITQGVKILILQQGNVK